MSPAPDERDRIHAAMNRILAGRAEHSNGALTIVALALEAKVPRNALTQRHTDLKAEFYEQVRARGGTPDSERRLRHQVRRSRSSGQPTRRRSPSSKLMSRHWWVRCTRPRWRTATCATNQRIALVRTFPVQAPFPK
ncbi:hypothetical protein ACWC4J_15745 [Streptomyces sp. NPDC001356]